MNILCQTINKAASVQRQDSRALAANFSARWSTAAHCGAQPTCIRAKSATLSSTSWCSLRPDLNVDDLAFFHSLQTDVTLPWSRRRTDESCWLLFRSVGKSTRLRRWRAFGAVYTDHFQGFWRLEVTMTTSAIVEVALLIVSALSMATSTTS